MPAPAFIQCVDELVEESSVASCLKIFEYMEGPEYLYYMSKHAINLPVTISVQIAGSKQRATQNGREG